MSRSLIVVFPGILDRHAAMIREAAARHGFECRFFQNASQAMDFLPEAEVILGEDPELARRTPNLRWICSRFAGVDTFLAADAFANPKAMLSNSSGAYGVTIAEHIVMVLLEILRRRPEYLAHVQRREWVRQLPVRAILGSRITLLGAGNIGQEAAERLKSFRPARILGVNRSGKHPGGAFDEVLKIDELNRILPETDVLVISLPGTRDTFHMIGEKQLKLLPEDAVIVNVGRGSVIDQTALERELRSGRLHAALDVFEQEPIPADSTLWDCPRLIITPHVAGDLTLPYTVETIIAQFLEDFDRYCGGLPPKRLVDRSAGY